MKLIKKLLLLFFVVFIVVAVLNYFQSEEEILLTVGTDSEKINYTLEKFEESFNNGDFDSLLKCCTGRAKSDLKSQMGIASSVFGSIISFVTSDVLKLGDGALENIWSMGTAYCQMDLVLIDIQYLSEIEAQVELNHIDMTNGKETLSYIMMEEENEIWRISTDFYEYSKIK